MGRISFSNLLKGYARWRGVKKTQHRPGLFSSSSAVFIQVKDL